MFGIVVGTLPRIPTSHIRTFKFESWMLQFQPNFPLVGSLGGQQIMAGECGSRHEWGRALHLVPGSWLQPGSALAVGRIWRMNQRLQDLSVYLSNS